MLVTVHSVSGALLLDRLLKQQGVAGEVIPVPRELSSSCGYAVETAEPDVSRLVSLMDRNEIEWEAVYEFKESYRLVQKSEG